MSRPLLHALLNGTAAAMLVLGWRAVRAGNVERHKAWMTGAFGVSTVFLASYLEYHGRVGHLPFWGEGALAVFYGFVLWPHVALAAVMVPMILATLVLAMRGRIDRHRRLARWTLPIWLYVSVTGVAVYVLNHLLRPA